MEQNVPSQVFQNKLFHNKGMEEFGKRFYSLRTEKNLSRKQVAEALGVSVRLISYWENGERECDFYMLVKICAFFSVSADYILGITEY